jgi:UDP-GlcNAc:undecaprenyl-phosphate/decaprenyl-phosphate GlcNAc-1-phosphate transferase
MTRIVLWLIPASMVCAWVLTRIVRRLSVRLNAMDSAGVAGQIKADRRAVPNTGGIAIASTIISIIAGGLLLAVSEAGVQTIESWLGQPGAVSVHVAGILAQRPLAIAVVASVVLLHVLGLIDDRRPMGPWIKLAIMAIPAIAMPCFFETRLLTALGSWGLGPAPSIVITVLWFLVVTNAMNFMDNMDGLAAGTSAIACAALLTINLSQPQPQWFVGAMQALIIGACLGFLWFNFPVQGRASIYMGDGGSLVLGFLIAFLTVRATYVQIDEAFQREVAQAHPGTFISFNKPSLHGAFIPLIVLAIPLYDFVSVVVIRLRQGRSPFVGDTQHFSHRLVQLGLTRKAAVMVIWSLVGITGITGLLMPRSEWAIIAALQVLLTVGVLATLEFSAIRTPKDPLP